MTRSASAAEAQAVSAPASPDYHHFLTPKTFAQRFGATPATIAQVVAALKNEGLAVGTPSTTGLSIPVSGTVAQVQSAFSTPIDRYRLSSGKTGYDNRAAPQVPTTVAPQIEGILGLDTLSPPQPTTNLPEANATGAHGGTPLDSPALAPGQPSPQSGTCSTQISNVETKYGALDVPELAQAYSFDPLYSSSDYGAGATVALVELSGAGYSTSDITNFANCYGITLGGSQISKIAIGGGGATGSATVEAELDIETVLSLAPKANIEVYEGGASDDLYDVFSKIVSDDTAKIVSASWTNGCESYVGQAFQNSENTLFESAAVDGQSIFVASGDQGSEGCNINGVMAAQTGSNPVAQVADASTGTLYVANESSNNLSVESEGTTGNPSGFATAASVTTGQAPDAVALSSSLGKVFVANATSNSLTVFSTSSCNQTTTSGCASPTQIASGGHLSGPSALAVNGTTLYVGNTNGTVAVYNANTNTWKATVTLPLLSTPTALAVDAANGWVYLSDGANNRIEYFNVSTCNASVLSGCSGTPATVAVGVDPVSLAVDAAAGSLYVANAGTNALTSGGVSVVSLTTHAVTSTIPTSQPSNGTGLVQSVALSPDGNEVLAVLDGLGFPGDVMATINPTSQSITATVNLETGTDTMGGLASDSSRDLVWVTDESAADDVVQNLNLAVSDPASQPYVTSVGGTSVTALGPAPTENTWNDQLHYSEGAGGGGISKTFAMPSFQTALGTVSGTSGTPCGAVTGDCREVPDVSADADPSTGYVVYDSVNHLSWTAIGGTSGAAPLWAAVLAVAAAADSNTTGYGAMNPILYGLAQGSPGTYLNDVTSGNNDYNATNGGQFAAATGYDMATGLGTPVTSSLATGLMAIPLDVAVTGTQVYGGTPTFGATVSVGGQIGAPYGVAVNTAGITCTEVGTSTPITSSLPVASDTLLPSSCGGVTLGGANMADYTVVYTSASGDFNVTPAPVDVAVSGSQTFGGSPTFNWSATSPPAGITVSVPTLTCTEVMIATPISPSLAAGSHTLVAAQCSGASLSGTNSSDYAVVYTSTVGNFPVSPAPLTITASSGTMTYGGTVPTITPIYGGFVNGNTAASLTTLPTCSTSGVELEHGGGLAVHVVLHGGSRHELRHRLRRRHGERDAGSAHRHGVERHDDLRRDGADHHGELRRVQERRLRVVADASAHLLDGGDELERGDGIALHLIVHGGVRPQLRHQRRRGERERLAGPTVRDRVRRFDDVRGHAAVDHPELLGVRERRRIFVADHWGILLDDRHELEYGARLAVPVVVRRGVRPQLRHHLSRGVRHRRQGAPQRHRLERHHDLRRDATRDHGQLLGVRQRRLEVVPVARRHLLDHGHRLEPCLAAGLRVELFGAVDPNYSFSYVGGSVSVMQAPLTVTASSGTMTYGGTPPTITAGYAGFVNGDTSSSLTTKPTCSTAATSSSTVAGSPYPSTCSGAVDPNYAIGYVAGSVTVSQAPLTITASSGTMTYGARRRRSRRSTAGSRTATRSRRSRRSRRARPRRRARARRRRRPTRRPARAPPTRTTPSATSPARSLWARPR